MEGRNSRTEEVREQGKGIGKERGGVHSRTM